MKKIVALLLIGIIFVVGGCQNKISDEAMSLIDEFVEIEGDMLLNYAVTMAMVQSISNETVRSLMLESAAKEQKVKQNKYDRIAGQIKELKKDMNDRQADAIDEYMKKKREERNERLGI